MTQAQGSGGITKHGWRVAINGAHYRVAQAMMGNKGALGRADRRDGVAGVASLVASMCWRRLSRRRRLDLVEAWSCGLVENRAREKEGLGGWLLMLRQSLDSG